MNFTDQERTLLMDALARAASRQEAEARYWKRSTFAARRHDDKAANMRKLRAKLAAEGLHTKEVAAC